MHFHESLIDVDLNIPCHEIGSDDNINDLIMKKLQEKYQEKAFEKFGIIKTIKEIKKTIFQQIMKTNGSFYFIFTILVENYVPKIYDHIMIPVKKILPYGIYLEEKNLKILVSTTSSEKKIELNDLISVALTDIRYEKDSFHCLAKFN